VSIGRPQQRHLIRSDERRIGKHVSACLLLRHLFLVAAVDCLVSATKCGVGCFDVGSFCEGAGCRSAGSNGVISSEATSCGEASACLRAFCCGTVSLWLLSIVLSATKFESPVCEGGFMGSRFKDRELGAIEADERGGAEAGTAGGFSCFDVGSVCDGAGC